MVHGNNNKQLIKIKTSHAFIITEKKHIIQPVHKDTVVKMCVKFDWKMRALLSPRRVELIAELLCVIFIVQDFK